MAVEQLFDSGDRSEVTRVLDRDTRIGAAALICALALAAAAASSAAQPVGTGSNGVLTAAQSNAPAVFGLPAAPPALTSTRAHATSGGS